MDGIVAKLTIFIVIAHLVLFDSRKVDGLFCYTDFFLVAWLEAGSIFTFSDVDLGIVVLTTMWNLDVYLRVVVSAVMWKLNVDVSTCMFVLRSVEEKKLDG